jgi:TP53 regulating kinase-like protein
LENGSGGNILERLIAKGAEADIFLKEWNGKQVLVKQRNPKKYRHPELDKQLRSSRTIHEANIIHRAKWAGVPTPLLYQVDPKNAIIIMEYVDGEKIRDIVNKIKNKERFSLFKNIGKLAGILHKTGIIHGDLTTSNIIKQDERIVMIDFGLAENSIEIEKKGVDLNLMNRMLSSTHYNHKDILLKAFKIGYKEIMHEEAGEVLIRMEEIAKRGRYIEKK